MKISNVKEVNKKAFTLAEVLITLAVIGIVAVLTIPGMIAKYQKHILLTRLKKAYVEINTALRLASIEHGDKSTWDYGTAFSGDSAAVFIDTYIAPYMKLSKNCGKNSGCLTGDVYSLDGVRNDGYGDTSTKSARAVTSSGYAITVTSGGDYVTINMTLNNKKSEKLVLGKNVFSFNVGNVPDAYTREELLTSRYGCGHTGGEGAGLKCLYLIILDGWKFADDYPW